jgi:bifunctional glutamyl/prolyl-tRNA synthetase
MLTFLIQTLVFRFFAKMVGSSPIEINTSIVNQGDLVRELKTKKADKTEVKQAVDVLLKLKADFKAACGIDWKPGVEVPSGDGGEQENTSPTDSIDGKIKIQGDKVRELKANKASKDEIKAAVDELLSLKKEYKSTTGKDWAPGDSNKSPAPKSNPRGETMALGGKQSEKDENVLKVAAAEGIDIKIQTCGDLIRKLKLEKAGKEIIDGEVKVLLLLKNLYKEKTGSEWKPATAAPKPAKQAKSETPNEGYVNFCIRIRKEHSK